VQLSRRTICGIIGAAAVVSVSGCTATGLRPNEKTGDQPTNSDTDTFRARLSGPETEQLLFSKADISTVGEVQTHDGSFVLPITVTEDVAASISETFRSEEVSDNTDAFEIVLVSNGEEIDRFGIGPELVERIAAEEWKGELTLTFTDREQAKDMRETLM
jgi:hypothetical protein